MGAKKPPPQGSDPVGGGAPRTKIDWKHETACWQAIPRNASHGIGSFSSLSMK